MKILHRAVIWMLIFLGMGLFLSSCGGLGIFEEKKVVSPEIIGDNSNDDHFVSERVNQSPLSEGKMLDDINSGILNRLPSGFNLIRFPQKFSSVFIKQTVRELVGEAYKMADNGAVNKAGPLKTNTIKRLEQNCNIEKLPETMNSAFAVVTKKSPLLLLPTTDVWFKDKNSRDRNLLHNDELTTGEPVAVLSVSYDKRYYLVQTRFSRGWIPRINIAFTRYLNWLKIVKPTDFAVVKSPVYTITLETKPKVKKSFEFYMGDVILIDASKSTFEKPIGLLPINENGILSFKEYELSSDAVKVGFLPLTRKNILSQARIYKNLSRATFSSLPELRSNSRMISRVYRSLGIYMPLNLEIMKRASLKQIDLIGLPYEQRLSRFISAKPGDLLFFEDDVALFYGTTPRYSKRVHGIVAYMYVNSVLNEINHKKVEKKYDRIMVSDLKYLRTTGHMAFNDVEFIGQFFTSDENSKKLQNNSSETNYQYNYDPLYIDELGEH